MKKRLIWKNLNLFGIFLMTGCGPVTFQSHGTRTPTKNNKTTKSRSTENQTSGVNQSSNEEKNVSVETLSGEESNVYKSVVPGESNTLSQIIETCSSATKSGTVKTKTQSFFFPARKGCLFGQNGNLNKLDGKTTARHEETMSFEVANLKTLCSLNFVIPAQPMQFDDELLIGFNSTLLASSRDFADKSVFANSTLEPDKNGFLDLSWEKIRGLQNLGSIDASHPYCLGMPAGLSQLSNTCKIPLSQTVGEMIIQIPNEKATLLAQRVGLDKTGRGNLTLMVTGDNDESPEFTDCSYLNFAIEMKLTYLPK